MSNNEFSQKVAIDFVPRGSICEWCGGPAVQQLTSIGGRFHNTNGFFCQACGELFTHLVSRPADDASEQEQPGLRPPTRAWAESTGNTIPIPLD